MNIDLKSFLIDVRLGEKEVDDASAALEAAKTALKRKQDAASEQLKQKIKEGDTTGDLNADEFYKSFGFKYSQEVLDRWLMLASRFGAEAKGKIFAIKVTYSSRSAGRNNEKRSYWFGTITEELLRIGAGDSIIVPAEEYLYGDYDTLSPEYRQGSFFVKGSFSHDQLLSWVVLGNTQAAVLEWYVFTEEEWAEDSRFAKLYSFFDQLGIVSRGVGDLISVLKREAEKARPHEICIGGS